MWWKRHCHAETVKRLKWAKLRRWILVPFPPLRIALSSSPDPPRGIPWHSAPFTATARLSITLTWERRIQFKLASILCLPCLSLLCSLSPSSFHFPLYGRHSNRRQARQRRHCGLFLWLPLPMSLFSASLTLYLPTVSAVDQYSNRCKMH